MKILPLYARSISQEYSLYPSEKTMEILSALSFVFKAGYNMVAIDSLKINCEKCSHKVVVEGVSKSEKSK